MAGTTPGGAFAITRLKVFLALSLALCWWTASIFPRYKPMIQAEFKSRLEEARQKIPSIKVDWHTSVDDDPRSAYNNSKVALLIEPRPLPHLVPQILHMISVVPPDWRFLFIGTEKSVVSVGRAYATKHQQIIGKLDLMVLPEPWEIDTKEKTYRLLSDRRFYDEFLPGVEWLLKYESDSIMCANSDESLNDWLGWHWAGATRNDRFAGNGGLSIRRVSAIKRVLSFQERYNDTEAEDEWFGKRIAILPGAKVASGTDGVLAVETVYKEKAIGYHVRDGGSELAEDVWKDPSQRKQIFNYCPELSMIMDMKLERERCSGDDRKGSIHPSAEEIQRQRLEEQERRKQLAAEEKAIQDAKKAKEEEDAKKAQAEQDNESKETESVEGSSATASSSSTSSTSAAATSTTSSEEGQPTSDE